MPVKEQMEYVCRTVRLNETQKTLRKLYYLIMSYANIYELYVTKQILSLSHGYKLEKPAVWLKDFESIEAFQYVCVGKTKATQLSRSSITQLLHYGYTTTSRQRRRIMKDKPWLRSHLLHQYLYDDRIWYRYSLNKPYLPIQASFEIEKQMFSKEKLRIPKYGYVDVNHNDLRHFPIGYIPIAGRLFVEQDEDGKFHGYVSVACEQMELDDGFVKLIRRK